MSLEDDMAELRADLAKLAHLIAAQGAPVTPASFTIKDAAIVLGVDRSIVRRLITEGHLLAACYPGMTDRRIPRTSIDAFLTASLISPTPTLEVAS